MQSGPSRDFVLKTRGAWARLRQHVLNAPLADRTEVVRLGRARLHTLPDGRSTVPLDRALLAYAAADTRLAREALQATTPEPLLLLCSLDVDGCQELAATLTRQARRPYLETLLARFGAQALDLITAGSGDFDPMTLDAIQRIWSVPSRRFLAGRLDDDALRQRIERALEQTPSMTLVALDGMRRGFHADALMQRLARQYAALIPQLPTSMPAGPVRETAQTVPPVLRTPPSDRVLPGWVRTPSLPPVLVDDQELPVQAVALLVQHMMEGRQLLSPPPAFRDLKRACEPASLAALAWAVFEAWNANGAPREHRWALFCVGLLGDEECARRLRKEIRELPGADTLARIRGETTLVMLADLAERGRFEAMRKRARIHVADAGARLGLEADELEERLVPTLGLDDGHLDAGLRPAPAHRRIRREAGALRPPGRPTRAGAGSAGATTPPRPTRLCSAGSACARTCPRWRRPSCGASRTACAPGVCGPRNTSRGTSPSTPCCDTWHGACCGAQARCSGWTRAASPWTWTGTPSPWISLSRPTWRQRDRQDLLDLPPLNVGRLYGFGAA